MNEEDRIKGEGLLKQIMADKLDMTIQKEKAKMFEMTRPMLDDHIGKIVAGSDSISEEFTIFTGSAAMKAFDEAFQLGFSEKYYDPSFVQELMTFSERQECIAKTVTDVFPTVDKDDLI